MLSMRRLQSVAWTLLGFMLVAALVLDMRYKALEDGTGYLDTWTGAVRSTAQPARAGNQWLEFHVPSPVVIPERFEIVVPDSVVRREKIELRIPEPIVVPERVEIAAGVLESRARLELMERALASQAERLERLNVRFSFPAPAGVHRHRR